MILLLVAGSGLSLTEQPFNMPGCEGSVKASDLKNPDVCPFKNGKPDCKSCVNSHPCTECQYFPIYPCYSQKVCCCYPILLYRIMYLVGYAGWMAAAALAG